VHQVPVPISRITMFLGIFCAIRRTAAILAISVSNDLFMGIED
jgi:hypothetical protein